MNQEAGFVPENRSIESLFFWSQEKYIIPRYQRPYTRGKDQANDFWIDLNTDEGQPNFIGSIVLDYGKKNQTGLIEIIDWQQRIMTITIFMATIRDIAKLFDDEIYSYVTQSQCISYVTHRGTSDWEYRITSGDWIRSFFEKYIQSGENNILEYDGRKDKDFWSWVF